MAKFGRIKFTKETSNGAGKYHAECWAWYQDTRCTREHAAPDIKGIGEGDSPEAARSDAASSAQRNDTEACRNDVRKNR